MAIATQQPMFPSELSAAIASVAADRSLLVASDTHYDAGNMEIQWWSKNNFYRLDFQPTLEGYVQVAALTEAYPYAGRVLRFAGRVIPFFPRIAETKQQVLDKLEQPFLLEQLRTKIQGYLTQIA